MSAKFMATSTQSDDDDAKMAVHPGRFEADVSTTSRVVA